MREILFRGKRKDNEEQIEGFYFCMVHDDGSHVHHFIMPLGVDLSLGTPIEKIQVEVNPETICQYTGLTDKNGRKIFEGDIVRDIFNASVVGVVRYGEYRNTFNDDKHGGHVGFYVEWKEKQDLLRKDLVYWVKNSEFTGNISGASRKKGVFKTLSPRTCILLSDIDSA